jgi:hypothetical protein
MVFCRGGGILTIVFAKAMDQISNCYSIIWWNIRVGVRSWGICGNYKLIFTSKLNYL